MRIVGYFMQGIGGEIEEASLAGVRLSRRDIRMMGRRNKDYRILFSIDTGYSVEIYSSSLFT